MAYIVNNANALKRIKTAHNSIHKAHETIE